MRAHTYTRTQALTNGSILVETSSWLEQIQTANICLNVERDCISVILWAKVGPPWGNNSWSRP